MPPLSVGTYRVLFSVPPNPFQLDPFVGSDIAGTGVASVLELKKNQVGAWDFGGTRVWVARTGYTGEDGFEVVSPASIIEAVWTKALALGHVGCLQPCGLGARDTQDD